MEQNTENSLFDLSIDETAKDHLRRICSWTMIIVVTAVIGYAVAIIKALMQKTQVMQSEGFGVSVSSRTKHGKRHFCNYNRIAGLIIFFTSLPISPKRV